MLSGTVYAKIDSYPTQVCPGELSDVRVAFYFTGDDNDGPWMVTDLCLRDDDDGITSNNADPWNIYNNITCKSNVGYITAQDTWYAYTFEDVNLSAYDDGGNGIELFVWLEIDDNDPIGNPDGASTNYQVLVTYPTLECPTRYMNFGSTVTSSMFNIRNSGCGTLSYSITDNRSWLSVSPTNGSSTGEWDQIKVYVNRDGLGHGNYDGIITINPSRGEDVEIEIDMSVVDNTPPPCPTYDSNNSDRAQGVWSRDNDVDIWWNEPYDVSGIAGYSRIADYSQSTIPDKTIDTTSRRFILDNVADTSGFYLHVRAVDTPGNWSNCTAHFGPFKIDTTKPGQPIHRTPGAITSDTTPTFDWDPITTDLSGIAYYELYIEDALGSGIENKVYYSGSNTSWTPTEPFPYRNDYKWKVRAVDNAGNVGDWSNAWALEIYGRPDLVISGLTLSQTSGYEGQSITINSVTRNDGEIDTDWNTWCKVRYYLGGYSGELWREIGWGWTPNPLEINGIYVGEEEPDQISWTVDSDLTIGRYYITAVADADDDIDEDPLDEFDSRTVTFDVIPIPLADLIGGGGYPSGTYHPGDTVEFTFSVLNDGDAASNAGSVHYFANKGTESYDPKDKIGGNPYSNLAIDQASNESFSWNIPQDALPGIYVVSFWVDATDTTPEGPVGEANNKGRWYVTVEEKTEIISAYWLEEDTIVDEGTLLHLVAEVSGYDVGELFDFDIRENDHYITPNDDYDEGLLTGTVFENDGKKYVKVNWVSVWDSDLDDLGTDGDLEYYFIVTAPDDQQKESRHGDVSVHRVEPAITSFHVVGVDEDNDGFSSSLEFSVVVSGGTTGITNGSVLLEEDDWWLGDDELGSFDNITIAPNHSESFVATVYVMENEKLWGDGLGGWFPCSSTEFEFEATLLNSTGSRVDTDYFNDDMNLEILDGDYYEHLETPSDVLRNIQDEEALDAYLESYYEATGGKPTFSFGGSIDLDITGILKLLGYGAASTGVGAPVTVVTEIVTQFVELGLGTNYYMQLDIADMKGLSEDADGGDLTDDWITVWTTGGLYINGGLEVSSSIFENIRKFIPISFDIACGITPLQGVDVDNIKSDPLYNSTIDYDPVNNSIEFGPFLYGEGALAGVGFSESIGLNGVITPDGLDVAPDYSLIPIAGPISTFNEQNDIHIGSSILTPASLSAGVGDQMNKAFTFEIRADMLFSILELAFYGAPKMVLEYIIGDLPDVSSEPPTGWNFANLFADAVLGQFTGNPFIRPATENLPDTVDPNANLIYAPEITTDGCTTYTFTVEYNDNVAIDVSTIDGSDILVDNPNGANILAEFVSADPSKDTSPITATYRYNAPGGTWDLNDNGTYDLWLQYDQVFDTSKNPVQACKLGSFNVDIPAKPSLFITDTSMNEGNSDWNDFNFTVSLSNSSTQTITVNYSTSDNSAVAPNDYTAVNGTLTFTPGQPTSQTVPVPVRGDTTWEPNEQFRVVLSGATNATIADSLGIGTILNDDPVIISLDVGDISITEGNSGTKNALFPVTVASSNPAAQMLTVQYNYATANGTATAGTDYSPVSGSGSLALPAMGTMATFNIPVPVFGETLYESNEVFYLDVTVTIDEVGILTTASDRGQCTILNDDLPPHPIFIESDSSLDTGTNNDDVDLADLDSDGDLDAFVTARNASNQVWLNDGCGRFVKTDQSLSFADNVYAALGDIDNDGDIDAVVACLTNEVVALWRNDGSGQFFNSGSLLADSPVDVALGDLNLDGKLDIYIAQIYNADLIYFNDGLGGFVNSGQLISGSGSRGIELADLDQDGDLDAFIPKTEGALGAPNDVWFNDGNGFFVDSGQRLGNGKSQHVALGDLDKDGDIDAFEVNSLNGAEPDRVWFNDGNGFFTDSGQLLGNNCGSHVALADLDLDGDLDAFVANWSNQPDNVWLNDGSGVFINSGQELGMETSSHVAIGDIDRDGDIDAIVADFNDSQPNRIWLNSSIVAPVMVLGHEINNGAIQRSGITSIQFRFSEPVNVTDQVLTICHDTNDFCIDMTNVQIIGNGTDVVTWDLTDTVLADSNLSTRYEINGDYTVTLNAVEVTSVAGNIPLSEDYQSGFHRLLCDGNGNRVVDLGDIIIWLNNRDNEYSNPYGMGDFNGDRLVDLGDAILWLNCRDDSVTEGSSKASSASTAACSLSVDALSSPITPFSQTPRRGFLNTDPIFGRRDSREIGWLPERVRDPKAIDIIAEDIALSRISPLKNKYHDRSGLLSINRFRQSIEEELPAIVNSVLKKDSLVESNEAFYKN